MKSRADGSRPAAAGARRTVPATGLGLLLREAYRAFNREFSMHLAKHRITHAQWMHLWLLSREGSLTPVDLSRAAGIKKASSTAVLEELAQRRLIARTRDTVDRRKVNLRLTPAGVRLLAKLTEAARITNTHARSGISDADMARVYAVLRKAIANMDRHTGGAPEPVERRTSCK